jgi:hypothetical protein
VGGNLITVGAAEHRSENRIKRAACLSVSSVSEIASSASAGFHEKRRKPASAGKPPGPDFFWVLFFGGAKKSTSPIRRNTGTGSHGFAIANPTFNSYSGW